MFRGVRLGVPICEDIWTDEVCETLVETGAELLLVPNGSPFEDDKEDTRLSIVVARITETGLPLAYLNQVGGQDELVFDGGSFALNADRTLAFQMPAFKEDVAITRWARRDGSWRIEPGAVAPQPAGEEEVWLACVLGMRDYVRKNGFPGVVLGLSGGIDSAVVAAMAVDALGPDKVHCVMMPYRYTAAAASRMPRPVPRRSACRYDIVPIAAAVEASGTDAGTAVPGARARRDRGEHPVAGARHHSDGDLQQVRVDGADDGQQVGDVGRLCDALWRHEWRLQSDQGRLQDRGLRPGAVPQPVAPGRMPRAGAR